MSAVSWIRKAAPPASSIASQIQPVPPGEDGIPESRRRAARARAGGEGEGRRIGRDADRSATCAAGEGGRYFWTRPNGAKCAPSARSIHPSDPPATALVLKKYCRPSCDWRWWGSTDLCRVRAHKSRRHSLPKSQAPDPEISDWCRMVQCSQYNQYLSRQNDGREPVMPHGDLVVICRLAASTTRLDQSARRDPECRQP